MLDIQPMPSYSLAMGHFNWMFVAMFVLSIAYWTVQRIKGR